jgi:hypothetical protein
MLLYITFLAFHHYTYIVDCLNAFTTIIVVSLTIFAGNQIHL